MKYHNSQNPRHYRLDFISENTFNRIWSIRMSPWRVVLGAAGCLAAFAALIFVVIAWTPLRTLLPGSLRGDLRLRYIETAMRVDSLDRLTQANEAYLSNLLSIMRDEIPETEIPEMDRTEITAREDSLLAASEAERAFVRRYEEEERFNLSVLAPIAAEGMVFSSPVPAGTPYRAATTPGLRIENRSTIPVTAVYRGTVVGVYESADGTSTITIQHPNDFVSVYSGIGDVFTDKGDRIRAGQRIGHTTGRSALTFELWHNGTALDPNEYIAFE